MSNEKTSPLPSLSASLVSFPLRGASSPLCARDNGLSPMTDLTFTLGSMLAETPKRRISWSSVSSHTPSPAVVTLRQPSESPSDRPLADISHHYENKAILPLRTRLPQYSSLLAKKESVLQALLNEHDPCDLKPLQDNTDKETQDWQEDDSESSAKVSNLLQHPLVEKSPVISSKENNPHRVRSCIRGLFCQVADNSKLRQRPAAKRAESSSSDTPTIHNSKRRKAVSFCASVIQTQDEPSTMATKIQRSYSETEATTIMKAVQLAADNPDLIGDFTRPYALPIVMNKHQDLKSISAETMRCLIRGDFCKEITEHIVIDCRFPYEFNGGHIKGAHNIFTKEELMKEFFDESKIRQLSNRAVIVFHCEFSSERGPTLTRFLRNKDREANTYPRLYYPEVYLLDGGYKAFFEKCKDLCDPQAYKPMTHKDHEQDLKFFRSKARSWHEESKSKIIVRPGLKF